MVEETGAKQPTIPLCAEARARHDVVRESVGEGGSRHWRDRRVGEGENVSQSDRVACGSRSVPLMRQRKQGGWGANQTYNVGDYAVIVERDDSAKMTIQSMRYVKP